MEELIVKLPPLAQNYLNPKSPKKMKMMAASGKLPLPPQHLTVLLCLLAQDPDEEVKETAKKSLKDLPLSNITSLLQADDSPQGLLDFLARLFYKTSDLTQLIILNKRTADQTIAWLSQYVSGSNLEIIALNQQRQMRFPPLVETIIRNSELSNVLRVQVIEFALRQRLDTGLTDQELEPYITERIRESIAEGPKEIEYEEINEEIPDWVEEEAPQVSPAEAARKKKKEREAKAKGEESEEEEEGEEGEKKELTIEQQVMTWNVSQKIKAAMRGNKQVRGLMIRESNRLVCTAVMKNPKITETEVVKISASRNVSEDVIREVIRNRDWMRIYQIKANLCANPKCPTSTAMRLLPNLRTKNLRDLSTNKNVPSVVSALAKKLFKSRGPGSR